MKATVQMKEKKIQNASELKFLGQVFHTRLKNTQDNFCLALFSLFSDEIDIKREKERKKNETNKMFAQIHEMWL